MPLQTRRSALQQLACGFGYMALAGLAAQRPSPAAETGGILNPLAPKPPQFPARAKRVIFLFMQGGVSHVDSFDWKPRLVQDDGRMLDFDDLRSIAKTGKGSTERVMKPLWDFLKQRGESGLWISDLFPEMAKHADDLCVVRSMHTEGVAHGPATLFLHTGSTNFIRPSMGSRGDLRPRQRKPKPARLRVSIAPCSATAARGTTAAPFSPRFIKAPSRAGLAVKAKDTSFRNITPARSLEDARRQFDLLRELNGEQLRPKARRRRTRSRDQ